MKRTKLFVMLVLALLLVTIPLTAMAAVEDSVIPEDGDISVIIPSGPQTPMVYTVVFEDGQGNVLSTAEYSYGAEIVFPAEAPAKAEDNYGTYTFANWVDKQDATGKPAPTNCIGNATYVPGYDIAWKEYTVVFKDEDGFVYETQTLHWEEAIQAPIPSNRDINEYEFIGWTPEMSNTCQGDAVYVAQWKKLETVAKDGWQKENGVWYYYENNVKVVNDWRKDTKGWCFLTEDGSMAVNTFVQDSVGWAYVDASGYYYELTKWVQVDGVWYYLEKGYSVRNAWRKDSKGWCFLTEDGSMAVNTFVKDSVGWAYVDKGGYYYVVTKWIQLDGKWYYLEGGYSVRNAWRKDSEGWCYLTEDGSMMTNDWLKDSVGWCYIGAEGYCLANGTYTIDGHQYTFDANGRIEGEPIR